ncbi:hypothetical protein AA313_de0207978 [Arthrobotrys entomopaga]|nr:hypothetical protein AA313_de0207978 [Arthrobotrys entomopaga]
MVTIDKIKASNAVINGKLPSGLVALFVGATNGIGESTLRKFYTTAPSPRVYFIGRSQSSAERIISSLQPLNPTGHLEFIQADVSLLKNVDEATRKFLEKETEVNLLVMSQGVLTMEGRTETSEGIDTKLALNYFSRAKLISNLLPALTSAAASSSSSSPTFGARVLSILSTGQESDIDFDDYELKNTYTLRRALTHAVTSNSAIVQYLSATHPTIGFIHAYPGAVNTNMIESSRLPGYVKFTSRVLMPVFKGFLTSVEDSGERHFWLATDEKFGKGGWLVDEKGEESGVARRAVERGVCDVGVGEKVWRLSMGLFERVEKDGRA